VTRSPLASPVTRPGSLSFAISSNSFLNPRGGGTMTMCAGEPGTRITFGGDRDLPFSLVPGLELWPGSVDIDPKEGLAIPGVCCGFKRDDARRIVRELKLNWPTIDDTKSGEIVRRRNMRLPMNDCLLNSAGVIRKRSLILFKYTGTKTIERATMPSFRLEAREMPGIEHRRERQDFQRDTAAARNAFDRPTGPGLRPVEWERRAVSHGSRNDVLGLPAPRPSPPCATTEVCSMALRIQAIRNGPDSARRRGWQDSPPTRASNLPRT